MGSRPSRDRYDVVIAGARCAGASTAMLLARSGLSVLAVDPVAYGRDTLSTHAVMRGGVLQLHRWGLLDAVLASGTPPIRTTSFHYGSESVEIEIKERDGVDCLVAPRRTVLDPILVDAAREAGAEVVHGLAVMDLLRDADDRVVGARVRGSDGEVTDVSSDLVIGADGIRSRVARILGLEAHYSAPHAACSIYGYWPEIPFEGNHWFYEKDVNIGTIPTNDGEMCVFALIPQSRFEGRGDRTTADLHREALHAVSPDLGESVEESRADVKVRCFTGLPGFLRPATGPGWALVGDAGYFRDPITAHGITDALREAEALSRAITGDSRGGLDAYQLARDERVRGVLDVTDSIASFDWTLEEVQQHHLELNRQMKGLVDGQREWI